MAKMVKWMVTLVGLGIFSWVALCFFQVGHTHSPLDGTYGQLCVKLSFESWDDDKECVLLLQRMLANLGVDEGSRLGAMAYKLDESSDWEEWWNQCPAQFSDLCGSEAPNYFRACRRLDLGLLDMHGHLARDEQACQVDRNFMDPPDGQDIVVVIKPRISSLRITQVAEVLPAKSLGLLTRIAQPRGVAPRRGLNKKTRDQIAHQAEKLHEAHAISQAARDYLVKWSNGSLAKAPRPATYSFLQHRWADCRHPLHALNPPIPHEPRGQKRLQARPPSKDQQKHLCNT